MKIFVLIVLVSLCDICHGQSFDPSIINQTLGSLVSTSRVAETSGFGQSAKVYEESASYLYADHAKNNPYFSGAFQNQQQQNSSNNPFLNRVYTVFEARRMNSYYRDLEEWRKKERAMLKREGIYDRDAIEYLYGR
jgi:hypothetical protein